jgi:hypothetical protein
VHQFEYGYLKALVSKYDQRCNQDRQAIDHAIADSRKSVRHQLKRPSSLGIAFASGFAADTLKYQQETKFKQTDCQQKNTLPLKMRRTIFAMLAEKWLSKF